MLHELLHELGHKDAQLPFSQIPDDATNDKILQEAAFKNIKVPIQSEELSVLHT